MVFFEIFSLYRMINAKGHFIQIVLKAFVFNTNNQNLHSSFLFEFKL
jgi:hypothetical protein